MGWIWALGFEPDGPNIILQMILDVHKLERKESRCGRLNVEKKIDVGFYMLLVFISNLFFQFLITIKVYKALKLY